jgi:hypothetical protein
VNLKRSLVFAAVAALIAIGWVVALPQAPLAQGMSFNHQRHAGMACSACHRGVESSAQAGLPTVAICQNCHATAPNASAEDWWEAVSRGGPERWRQLTTVPPHVMFSHRRHVGIARLACASCHGEVGSRTAPPGRALVKVEMSSCVSCHSREGASEDCASCHR